MTTSTINDIKTQKKIGCNYYQRKEYKTRQRSQNEPQRKNCLETLRLGKQNDLNNEK